MKYTKITLPYKIKSWVLALGAQSKSAFCFAKGNTAYLSDSGGDLSDLENFKKFERDIKKFQKKLKIKPRIIACDLHPEYVSTKYALRTTNDAPYENLRFRTGHERRPIRKSSISYGARTTKIQHHEAHVASCMADNNIKGRVIGIAFDGTGFGADGNIWGGEFFVGGIKGFKRAAHLKYIPMPGAEAAIREPWRMAFSYLYAIYGKKRLLWRLRRLAMTGRKWLRNDMLGQMIDKKINSPLTSSMGRLFDGVSALIGVCDFAGYEGEAAIRLEKIISVQGSPRCRAPRYPAPRCETKFKVQGRYEFKYIDENGVIIIDWVSVIKGIAKDLKNGAGKPEISLKFHNAVCEMIRDVCNILRTRYRIKNVCLSGGVFQNKYLSWRLKPMLVKEGFNVYGHKKVPTHDGGIALGQAVLAYER